MALNMVSGFPWNVFPMHFSGFLMAFWSLIWIAAIVIAAVWIYRDSTERGMNGWLWVLAILFTRVLGGLFIYLAVRDRLTPRVSGSGSDSRSGAENGSGSGSDE